MNGVSANLAVRSAGAAFECARVRNGLLLGTACVALAWSPQATAQDGAPAADEVFPGEIIVTATKREQTLQDVPVAVTVTTGRTIEQAQIRDPKDLQSVVPSLRVNPLQSSANSSDARRVGKECVSTCRS